MHGEQAEKTGEYRDGIGRLLSLPDSPAEPLPPALADYLAAVRPFLAQGRYPGSPLIASALARPQDRLIACELNPLEFASLGEACHGHGPLALQQMDGYQALKAYLPPRERRGLILIDPPYEQPGELPRLPREVLAAHKRFPTGVYALWYPLKDEGPIAGLKRQLKAAGLRRMLQVELRLTPLVQGGMLHGCGMLILNPPWGFAQHMQTAMPALAAILAPGSGTGQVDWLVPE